MSRVQQLDSTALDQELHNLFRSELSNNIDIHRNKEEWNLLLDSLVFFFGSKFTKKRQQTATYGAELSGVTYNCKKRTLYLVAIFSNYLHSRISQKIYSAADRSLWNRLRPLYEYMGRLYSTIDLLNFARFLLSTGQTTPKYLSPIHWLLGASSSTEPHNPVSFYQNTVYAGIEFQNRQLLWNAILEFFNTTLLNNARWLNTRRHLPHNVSHTITSPQTCPRCQQFPTNPYRTHCCMANYCYVCVIKAIDSKYCDQCAKTTDLSAEPIY